jgi:predicted permease
LAERWRRYLRFWGPDIGADVEDELSYHVEQLTHFFVSRGLSPQDARQAASDAFGDMTGLRRRLQTHDRRKLSRYRTEHMLQDLAQDLRYALRRLRAEPRFSAFVVLVLALGIGANTAIFSAIDTAFLKPLPFPSADRLVTISDASLPLDVAEHAKSFPTIEDFAADSSVFAEVAAYASGGLNLSGGATPERVKITYVTSRFFATLGQHAASGRVPVPEEYAKDGPAAVVISHGVWQREFGGRPVVNHNLELNGKSYRIAGVMPSDFGFPGRTDVWIPLALPFGFDIMPAFRNFVPSVFIARLAPNATVAQAAQHADVIRKRFRSIKPTDDPVAGLVRPLQTTLVGDRRTSLIVLGASAALLLLIACANVMNLLLSRAAVRRRELAIRVVLGATRLRITRQLVAESLLLAGASAAIAVIAARFAMRMLSATLPQGLADVSPPGVDARVLAFTMIVALTTSLVFGVAPALGASRTDLGEAMKSAGAGGGGTRRRGAGARGALVVAEVSLAVMLLVGAGLMMESLNALLRTDSGLRPEQVVTGRLVFSGTRYPNAAAKRVFFDRALQRLRATPGIAAAAAVSALPMEGAGGIGLRVAPDDAPTDTMRVGLGLYLMATPGYFAAMGVTLHGEDLPTLADTMRRVAVINQTLAHTLWPGREAVGRQLLLGQERRTVVGVVADIRTRRLDEAPDGQMYLPMSEQPQAYASIVARGSGEPSAMFAALRDAVHFADPTEPLYSMATMSDVIDTTVAPRRTNTILLALFGSLAVVLAAVGVFAVLSYGVEQRRREIGVRVALGAQRADVISLVVRDGVALAGVGALIGLAAAFVVSRFVASMLYAVSPRDPGVFVGSAVVIAVVALAATLGPAARATSVDPLTALREE